MTTQDTRTWVTISEAAKKAGGNTRYQTIRGLIERGKIDSLQSEDKPILVDLDQVLLWRQGADEHNASMNQADVEDTIRTTANGVRITHVVRWDDLSEAIKMLQALDKQHKAEVKQAEREAKEAAKQAEKAAKAEAEAEAQGEETDTNE